MGPIHYDCLFIKGGNLDRDIHPGRTPSENKDRDQGDASPVQETPKIAKKTQKQGRGLEQILLQKEPTLLAL